MNEKVTHSDQSGMTKGRVADPGRVIKEQNFNLSVMVSHEKLQESLSSGVAFSNTSSEEIILAPMGTLRKQEAKEENNLCEKRWWFGIRALAIGKMVAAGFQIPFRGRASRICCWVGGGRMEGRQDGRKRSRNDTWVFHLSNQGDGGAPESNEED